MLCLKISLAQDAVVKCGCFVRETHTRAQGHSVYPHLRRV